MTTLDIIRNIRVASRTVSVAFEKETGSTIRHLLVLHALAEGDMIQSRVSELTGIDRSTMTGIVAKMEAAEYIKAQNVPHDNRAKSLHLTAKGRAHLEKLQAALEKLFGDRFGLPDRRASTLLNLLSTVANQDGQAAA